MKRSSLAWIAVVGMTLVGCAKDRDKDGYKGDDDCDDLNASVHPGADEVCDAIDNNCNGNVDEGLILEWYADKDDDGYGDLNTTVSACTQPSGYVDNSEDCDDTSELFRPGALESDCADPNDYNCDGSVGFEDADGDGYAACNDCDDTDPATFAPEVFYIDYDGDGFGDSNFPTQTACEVPDRYTSNDTDCDDVNADINPTAVEICNEADDDCDGETDEGVALTFYEDGDGDGYGNPESTQDACEVPEGFAFTADDCDDTLYDVNPGEEEVCDDGIDNDCDPLPGACELGVGDSDVVFWGVAAGDNAGMSTAGNGDLNGDGFDDIVIGAKHESTAGHQAGAVYVVYGRSAEEFADATTDGVMSLADADIILTGEAELDKAGRQVAILEDVSGTGSADLVVASPGADNPGESAGTVYVLFNGGVSGSLADADLIITESTGYNYMGFGLAGGDLVGDSSNDIIIGAPGNDVGGANTGTIWIVPGDVDPGEIETDSLTDYVTGQAINDGIGGSFDVLDVNGDGEDDLLVGVRESSEGGTDAGAVFVVFGPIEGAVSLADADVIYTGESAGDWFGASISTAGDTNSDGYDDWIAGAPNDDDGAPDKGAAYLVNGAAEEELVTLDEDGALANINVYDVATLKFLGDSSGDQFGTAVTSGGNVGGTDEAGSIDFVVTAPLAGGTQDLGAVYVFYGPYDPAGGAGTGTVLAAESDVRMDGDILEDQIGQNVAMAGEVDGSGNSFLMGSQWKDTEYEDAGAAYLMLDIGL